MSSLSLYNTMMESINTKSKNARRLKIVNEDLLVSTLERNADS